MNGHRSPGIRQTPGVSDIHLVYTGDKLLVIEGKQGGISLKFHTPGPYALAGPAQGAEHTVRIGGDILSGQGNLPGSLFIKKKIGGGKPLYRRAEGF
jgi:hypothetical protein